MSTSSNTPEALVAQASRPAPKKDRIYGSKKNPKGSSKSEKSARKIQFSAKTIASLRKKVAEHNKKAPKGRKATLAQLKAVYRRGAGAFSSSHRPGKTRDQWAMARVNAYLKLLRSGRPSNPNYKQDNDLLPRAHPRSSKGKTASAILAGGDDDGNKGYYTPAEMQLARSLMEIVDKHGPFDSEDNGIWVGYVPEAQNTDKEIGVHCHNCMLYQGDDNCAILSFKIEDYAKCRFAIFPAGAVKVPNPTVKKSDVDEIADLFSDIEYAESQLVAELRDEDDYDTPEDALVELAEYSGLGYDAIPALRAAWMRGVEEDNDGYDRARDLAVLLYESRDADLLPKESA